MLKLIPAVVMSCVALASGAGAVTLDPQAILQNATTIVLGDMVTSGTSHLEGPGYVGGNLTSATFDANTDGMAELNLGTVSGGLIVGGNLTANLNSANTGTVQVGGSYSGHAGTETVVSGADVPVQQMTSLFQGLSSNLAGLTSTDGIGLSSDMNNPTFFAGSGGLDGIAIFHLALADAVALFGNQNANFNFNMGTASALIINVAGDLSRVRPKLNSNQPSVLFNFYETTGTLDFGGGPFNASVLAPFAHVISPSGGMNGTLVAGSLNLGGEIRPYGNVSGYSGGLPDSAEVSLPAVPLPAGVWMMVAAFGAFAALRRRVA